MKIKPDIINILRCPQHHKPLEKRNGHLVCSICEHPIILSKNGIPLFAQEFCSSDAKKQQVHYDRVSEAYVTNLTYPHTAEYSAYLDRLLFSQMSTHDLGLTLEVCCGTGEGLYLLHDRIQCGIGIDVSLNMLEIAALKHQNHSNMVFLQGDATVLPISDRVFDTVIIRGGIHHVNDRSALFSEIFRVLKPGGYFYFIEPCNDFPLWRALRFVIYRLSPSLESSTERPLRIEETVPVLKDSGFHVESYNTHGFLGFCLLMNSDILLFNKIFRFIPGIRAFTRWMAAFDEVVTSFPLFRRIGLQVIGKARKI